MHTYIKLTSASETTKLFPIWLVTVFCACFEAVLMDLLLLSSCENVSLRCATLWEVSVHFSSQRNATVWAFSSTQHTVKSKTWRPKDEPASHGKHIPQTSYCMFLGRYLFSVGMCMDEAVRDPYALLESHRFLIQTLGHSSTSCSVTEHMYT